MHIKFMPYGKGSCQKAVDYLLGSRDHQGKVRERIEVWRGNPSLVADVADSLPFDNRYTSCVIAWSQEDKPDDREIQEETSVCRSDE